MAEEVFPGSVAKVRQGFTHQVQANAERAQSNHVVQHGAAGMIDCARSCVTRSSMNITAWVEYRMFHSELLAFCRIIQPTISTVATGSLYACILAWIRSLGTISCLSSARWPRSEMLRACRNHCLS